MSGLIFLSALGSVILAVGPAGHLFGLARGGPDIVVIGLWAWVWLLGRPAGLQFALFAGVLLDLLGFSVFGYWLLILLSVLLLIDFLKSRWLSVNSLIEAMVALLASCLLVFIVNSAFTREFIWSRLVIGLISDAVLGVIVYYIFALRLRLFARWAGKQV